MSRVIVRILAFLLLAGMASACAPSNGTNAAFSNYEYAPDAAFNSYPNTGYQTYGYASNQPRGVFQMNNNH